MAEGEGPLLPWESEGVQALSQALRAAFVQESQRAFMSGVYGWMCTGLGVSGVAAFLTASSETMMLHPEYFVWPLFIAQVAAAFKLPAFARRLSRRAVAALFPGYSLLNGVTLTVFLEQFYMADAICQALLLTAGTFGALGMFATVTKKDLSARGSLLFMGLFGVLLAVLVQLLEPSSRLEVIPMMSFITACASVGIFAALTAQDTQKLRKLHASMDYSASVSVSIIAALELYLGVITTSYKVLSRWFGERSSRRRRLFHN